MDESCSTDRIITDDDQTDDDQADNKSGLELLINLLLFDCFKYIK